MLEDFPEQRTSGIGQCYRILDADLCFDRLTRCRNQIYRGNHSLSLVHGCQHIVRHPGRDPRINVEHIGIRFPGPNLPLKHAPGFGTHVVGENNHDDAVAQLLH